LARNLIRKYGATVVLVHHTNKDAADIRGSTAIRGALDFLAMGPAKTLPIDDITPNSRR
jgi:hypothetical protein